ncbi:MAG: hypothetical protein ABIL62_15430, partial [Planctomycetota bacterium]
MHDSDEMTNSVIKVLTRRLGTGQVCAPSAMRLPGNCVLANCRSRVIEMRRLARFFLIPYGEEETLFDTAKFVDGLECNAVNPAESYSSRQLLILDVLIPFPVAIFAFIYLGLRELPAI